MSSTFVQPADASLTLLAGLSGVLRSSVAPGTLYTFNRCSVFPSAAALCSTVGDAFPSHVQYTLLLIVPVSFSRASRRCYFKSSTRRRTSYISLEARTFLKVEFIILTTLFFYLVNSSSNSRSAVLFLFILFASIDGAVTGNDFMLSASRRNMGGGYLCYSCLCFNRST